MRHKRISMFQAITLTMLFILLIMVFFFIFNKNEKNSNVKIGIIDSYIPKEKLNSRDIPSVCYVDEKEYINKHGTYILEIIKCEYENAQIFYASALNKENFGTIENIVQAIEWCIEQNVDIICMSFATLDNNKNLENAISKAINKKILIVASCINYSDDVCYPAMYDGVISVSEGINDNATIIIKNNRICLNIDENYIEVKGNSYTSAYICGYISKEFANGNTNLNSIIKKINNS